jgi:type I restriction enzyme M protein
MTLSLNKPKLDNLANEIWKSAERLRGKFKAYEYQNVILPIIVIRRLECVLIQWREKMRAEVSAKRPNLAEEALAKMVKKLELSQASFSNATEWTLEALYAGNHVLLEVNFRDYPPAPNRHPHRLPQNPDPRMCHRPTAHHRGRS